MIRQFVVMFAVLVPFAGCSSSPSANIGTAEIVGGSMVVKGESFTVPPGGDVTRCTVVRGTNTTAVYTNRFHNKQAGHHVILYAVNHPMEPGSYVCPQGGQWGWSEIYGSQTREDQYELPPGVGFKLEPTQQFVIETHVINASDQPKEAPSEFQIDFVDAGAVQYPAAALFVGTTNIAIEPRAQGQAEATCTFPADLHVARFYGHTHRHGTQLTAARVRDGQPETPFYTMDDWELPRILDNVEIKSGESLRVRCEYQNEEDKKLGYPDEMCVAAGFYWPGNGTLVCESYAGNPTCNCFQPVNPDVGSGGKTVSLEVSRAASIAGAAGNVSEGRPVYCYLYAKAELEAQGPLKAKLAYWAVTPPGTAPLETENDKVQLTMQDVTPGEYYATCEMDTIYGGYFPGTGDPIVFPYAPISVPNTGALDPVKVQLNVAAP